MQPGHQQPLEYTGSGALHLNLQRPRPRGIGVSPCSKYAFHKYGLGAGMLLLWTLESEEAITQESRNRSEGHS